MKSPTYLFTVGPAGLCSAARQAHVVAAQFRFGLALEHGFLHVDGNGGYQSVADVGIFLVLVVELLDGTGNVFLQGSLVCAALGGVLPVDKGVVFFAVLLVCVKAISMSSPFRWMMS